MNTLHLPKNPSWGLNRIGGQTISAEAIKWVVQISERHHRSRSHSVRPPFQCFGPGEVHGKTLVVFKCPDSYILLLVPNLAVRCDLPGKQSRRIMFPRGPGKCHNKFAAGSSRNAYWRRNLKAMNSILFWFVRFAEIRYVEKPNPNLLEYTVWQNHRFLGSLVSWFFGFLFIASLVSWFLGFKDYWFLGFRDLLFLGFEVLKIYKMFISYVQAYIDPVSNISKCY